MLIVITSVYYLFNEHVNTGVPSLGIMSRGCLVVWNHGFLWLSIPIGSMVLLYMVTWIPSIYPIYVCIYTSTSRIRHGIYWECHHPNWRSPSFFRGVGQPPTSIIFMIFLWYSCYIHDISMIFPKNHLNGKKVRNTGCWGPMFRQTMATSRYFSWLPITMAPVIVWHWILFLLGHIGTTYWNNILVSQIFLQPPKASSVAQYITQEFSAGDADHLSCRDQRGLVAGGSETAEDLPRTESGRGFFFGPKRELKENIYCVRICLDNSNI